MKTKIKTMETNPELSDEEIRRYMNFDALLGRARGQSFMRRHLRKAWLILPLCLSVLSVWLVLRNGRQEKGRTAPQIQVLAADSARGADRKTPVHHNKVTKEALSAAGNKPSVDESRAVVQPEKSTDVSAVPDAPDQRTPKGADVGNDVYVQAEPREGYESLYAYFSKNLSYPASAVGDSIEGIETISFTIDAQGNPVNIRVTQSLGTAFDEESVRLIRQMPPWHPAKLNGRPIASQLSVPLTFQVKRIKSSRP